MGLVEGALSGLREETYRVGEERPHAYRFRSISDLGTNGNKSGGGECRRAFGEGMTGLLLKMRGGRRSRPSAGPPKKKNKSLNNTTVIKRRKDSQCGGAAGGKQKMKEYRGKLPKMGA